MSFHTTDRIFYYTFIFMCSIERNTDKKLRVANFMKQLHMKNRNDSKELEFDCVSVDLWAEYVENSVTPFRVTYDIDFHPMILELRVPKNRARYIYFHLPPLSKYPDPFQLGEYVFNVKEIDTITTEISNTFIPRIEKLGVHSDKFIQDIECLKREMVCHLEDYFIRKENEQ